MTKKTLGIIIAVTCSGAIAGIVLATRPTPIAKNGSSVKSSQTFDMDTVAKHNSRGDCWTVINGKVYDITPYVRRHPGGSEILRACGIDGSTLFNTRRTAEGETVGSGTPHSSSARNILADFEIGTLAD
jgi:cytochrome b involved in lipid metabolism